jgi:hypothetical protein
MKLFQIKAPRFSGREAYLKYVDRLENLGNAELGQFRKFLNRTESSDLGEKQIEFDAMVCGFMGFTSKSARIFG